MTTTALTSIGAEHCPAAALPSLEALARLFDHSEADRAGIRLTGSAELAALLRPSGEIGRLAAERLGAGCRPVRAILFDKTEDRNWALGWHQDRTICVHERIDVPGFGPWTIKQGRHHVASPTSLLARMITLRVHLDDVGLDNAPLLVAPGSHRCGRVAEPEIADVVARCGSMPCLARAGDVWLYATLILHASERSRISARRRVLQVDWSADDLPGGLRWSGLS